MAVDLRASLLCLLGLSGFALGGCHTIPDGPREPLNLSDAKESVIAYHSGGAYERDLEVVAEAAVAWIERRVAQRVSGERLALVFDIDETVLSNYSHMKEQDFGYHPGPWTEWVRSAEAPAIEPVVRIFRRATALGVAVFFVTGRSATDDAEGTTANLRARGMGSYQQLILTPDDARGLGAEVWKASVRREIEAQGWTIIASIGDQWSDLRGGFAERVFKVPNPFYRID